jgi:hypothetical protein
MNKTLVTTDEGIAFRDSNTPPTLETLLRQASDLGIDVPEDAKKDIDIVQSFLNIAIRMQNELLDPKTTAAAINAEVAEKSSQQELDLCPLPTSMCRISPFFPLSKNELSKRKQITNLVIGGGGWGTLTFTGPQLSVFDEDYLLAVLALIHKRSGSVAMSDDKGTMSYKFKGKRTQLLRFCGFTDGNKNYKRLDESLDAMQRSTVTITISGDTHKRKKNSKWKRDNIITHVGVDEATDDIEIVINPYFYETYMANDYTLLDYKRRSRLKTLISKALYRFVMSQQFTTSPRPWNLETISQVLNLNDSLPLWKRRQQIAGAIRVLQKERILLPTSRIDENDMVWLVKHPVKSRPGQVIEE